MNNIFKKLYDSRFILSVIVISGLFTFSFVKPTDEQSSKDKNRKIETLTTENFDDFVQGKIVLIDFWASWCYPCRLQNPILEEVNTEIGDKVKIGKVNVDENKMLSSTYGITSIPTLLIFKKGKVVERLSGLQQKDPLIATLKKHMD